MLKNQVQICPEREIQHQKVAADPAKHFQEWIPWIQNILQLPGDWAKHLIKMHCYKTFWRHGTRKTMGAHPMKWKWWGGFQLADGYYYSEASLWWNVIINIKGLYVTLIGVASAAESTFLVAIERNNDCMQSISDTYLLTSLFIYKIFL